ncbi:MAG: hypothetical protein CM15mP92_2040 [Halieaceae bacterium]|nr:MAG: hypothetical protein CM15mP92_2040 [Halieaceae bacterium]
MGLRGVALVPVKPVCRVVLMQRQHLCVPLTLARMDAAPMLGSVKSPLRWHALHRATGQAITVYQHQRRLYG